MTKYSVRNKAIEWISRSRLEAVKVGAMDLFPQQFVGYPVSDSHRVFISASSCLDHQGMPPTGVRFGILANIAHPTGPEELTRICQAADRYGFDSLVFGDHLNWPIPEAWTTLSWAAGLTEHIQLSHLVLNNSYRHPTLLAKMGATLDVLSGGRFALGIGAGSESPEEYTQYGFQYRPFSDRVDRLQESLAILEAFWEEGSCDVQGDYYQLEQASVTPEPVQNPRPSIVIGGQSKKLMEIAARYEGWNFGFDLSPATCERRVTALAEYQSPEGSPPAHYRTSMGSLLLIGETSTEVKEQVRDLAESQNRPVEEFSREYADSLIGTPDELISRITAYRDAGVNEFLLWGPSATDPKALELFASEVMTAFEGKS